MAKTFSEFTTRRLVTALTPLSRLQQAPHSTRAEHFTVTTEDGVDLAGVRLGQRHHSALVLCHGFGSHQRSAEMVWLAEQLADHHDVITFDWRGYGRSGGAATLGGLEAYDLAAVVGWARARGYARVGVIGDSMGGLISLWAQGRLGLADALATISAPACYTRTSTGHRFLLNYVAPQPWAPPLAPVLLGFRFGALDPGKPLEVVEHIQAPLLLIHGDADRTVPIENAHALAAAAPQARLRIYPGAAHATVALRRSHAHFINELLAHFAPRA